jgi:hypothetical protein
MQQHVTVTRSTCNSALVQGNRADDPSAFMPFTRLCPARGRRGVTSRNHGYAAVRLGYDRSSMERSGTAGTGHQKFGSSCKSQNSVYTCSRVQPIFYSCEVRLVLSCLGQADQKID